MRVTEPKTMLSVETPRSAASTELREEAEAVPDSSACDCASALAELTSNSMETDTVTLVTTGVVVDTEDSNSVLSALSRFSAAAMLSSE